MSANIIDGKKLATNIKDDLKSKITLLKQKPNLAVIIVGSNPASQIYVKNKEKACQDVGIITTTYKLDANTTEKELENLIITLNNDKNINAILIQLPLPSHIDTQKCLSLINPIKDVDGFHPLNSGLLQKKSSSAIIPCTPNGIIKILHSIKSDLTGLNAVVIGRSQIVGLPVANLLLNENCTVTIAHSKTQNLASICKNADILVVAVGIPELITKEYIKKGAIIIDVGINRTNKGLKGDVNHKDALYLASYLTPVPGGVGPMTIAMLLENTYQTYLKQNNS